jgi:RND family efflux transporter MFP subunit
MFSNNTNRIKYDGIDTYMENVMKIKLGLIALILIGYFAWKLTSTSVAEPQYQTAQAEIGSLITSVSASGNITTGNNLAIVTNATGTVNSVYVKNGDVVAKGQKIAQITLDQDSEQKLASAYSTYLSAKNGLASAQNQLWTLQTTAFATNQKFINGAVAENLATSDPNYIQQQSTWLAAEGAYKNQANAIQQAQANVNSSWLNYQQYSATIIAPRAGVVANLTVAPGSVITVQSSTSSSPQQLGTISQPKENAQASVSLSEVDVVKVQPGQNVTMTLDAFADKTFTGKVLVINTNGSVSSGVTVYPATIIFDTATPNVYANMAVTAKIITAVKNDVVLVPSGAVKTISGQTTVQVMKNNKPTSVTVEIGGSNDTQTEVISGISAGDTVIIGQSNANTMPAITGQSGSVFGGFGGGGGGNVRIMSR